MSKLSKYLDSKLTNLFERGYRYNKQSIDNKIVSASSYDYLMNNLSGGLTLPYNTWSISPVGMMVIINHILINDIKTIVEFGSGISTIFLHNLSIKNGLGLKIISVDHDANWQQIIKMKYKVDSVKFIASPLDFQMRFKDTSYNWYNLEDLKIIDRKTTDFIIVDAPIGKTSQYERAGAFEFYKEELNRTNFSCYLDDTNFPPLKEIMNHYCQNVKFYSNFGIATSGNMYETEPVIFTK